MRLPILTAFLIFIIVLTIAMKLNGHNEKKKEEEFWERERKANATRKKDISTLPYISFTKEMLPMHRELSDINANEYMDELERLFNKKILNLTGQSNTDLKLAYGAPNITALTEYDQNYTLLVRHLARLAERYIRLAEEHRLSDELSDILGDSTSAQNENEASDNKNSHKLTDEEAAQLLSDATGILEYGVKIGTDVKLNYELLGRIYAEKNDRDSISQLINQAMKINSLSRNSIIEFLNGL